MGIRTWSSIAVAIAVLGSGASHARAQTASATTLELRIEGGEAVPARRAAPRGRDRTLLTLGVTGMALGGAGVVGGVVLVLAGYTRGFGCHDTWILFTCGDSLPDDTGLIAGGFVSLAVGALALVTGGIVFSQRPREPRIPRVSLEASRDRAMLTIEGAF